MFICFNKKKIDFMYNCYKLGIKQGLTEQEIAECLNYTRQRIAYYRTKLTDEIINNYYENRS